MNARKLITLFAAMGAVLDVGRQYTQPQLQAAGGFGSVDKLDFRTAMAARMDANKGPGRREAEIRALTGQNAVAHAVYRGSDAHLTGGASDTETPQIAEMGAGGVMALAKNAIHVGDQPHC